MSTLIELAVFAMAFVVRNLNAATIAPHLKKYFLDMVVKESWAPGKNDIICYLACDPTALYIGTLNGKPVATGAGPGLNTKIVIVTLDAILLKKLTEAKYTD